MSAPQQRGKEKQDKKPEFDYAVWDAVVSELQVRYSSYASISLTAGKAQVNKPGNMRSSDTAAFNARTGEITSVTAYDDIPRAQKMKGWFYAFHTGSWGGMTTKALYFGSLHRRNTASERILFVVEEKKDGLREKKAL